MFALSQRVRILQSLAFALMLTAAIALSGMFLSGQVLSGVRESALYRQSMIASSIFSEQDVGLGSLLTDAKARGTLLKFAGALADAYVSFELIPHNELDTFTAVFHSLVPAIEVESFAYRGKNLIIAGTSLDEAGYQEFLSQLRESGHFAEVRGDFQTSDDGVLRFEIECVSAA